MDWTFAKFLAILLVWSYLHIFIHETAHTVVGNWLGYQVREVLIGGGRPMFALKFGPTRYTFHWLPRGGLTIPSIAPDFREKLRPILFFAAGFLADLAVLVVVSYVFLAYRDQLPELARLGALCVMANQAIAIVMAAWPSDITDCRGQPGYNDGKLIAFALKGQTPPMHPKQAKQYVENVQRYDPSFQKQDIALDQMDNTTRQAFTNANLALTGGRIGDGLAQFSTLLQNASFHPAEKTLLCDELTTQVLIHGAPSEQAAALELVLKYQAQLLSAKTLKGTIGGLQVELGRHREALTNLLPLTSPDNEPIDRAVSMLYVAKAFRALGDEDSAQRYITLRQEVDHHDALTEKLDAAFGLAKS